MWIIVNIFGIKMENNNERSKQGPMLKQGPIMKDRKIETGADPITKTILFFFYNDATPITLNAREISLAFSVIGVASL